MPGSISAAGVQQVFDNIYDLSTTFGFTADQAREYAEQMSAAAKTGEPAKVEDVWRTVNSGWHTLGNANAKSGHRFDLVRNMFDIDPRQSSGAVNMRTSFASSVLNMVGTGAAATAATGVGGPTVAATAATVGTLAQMTQSASALFTTLSETWKTYKEDPLTAAMVKFAEEQAYFQFQKKIFAVQNPIQHAAMEAAADFMADQDVQFLFQILQFAWVHKKEVAFASAIALAAYSKYKSKLKPRDIEKIEAMMDEKIEARVNELEKNANRNLGEGAAKIAKEAGDEAAKETAENISDSDAQPTDPPPSSPAATMSTSAGTPSLSNEEKLKRIDEENELIKEDIEVGNISEQDYYDLYEKGLNKWREFMQSIGEYTPEKEKAYVEKLKPALPGDDDDDDADDADDDADDDAPEAFLEAAREFIADAKEDIDDIQQRLNAEKITLQEGIELYAKSQKQVATFFETNEDMMIRLGLNAGGVGAELARDASELGDAVAGEISVLRRIIELNQADKGAGASASGSGATSTGGAPAAPSAGSGASGAAASVDPDDPGWQKDDEVMYTTKTGNKVEAKILGVHYDDGYPYYTILVNNQRRQTEPDRLSARTADATGASASSTGGAPTTPSAATGTTAAAGAPGTSAAGTSAAGTSAAAPTGGTAGATAARTRQSAAAAPPLPLPGAAPFTIAWVRVSTRWRCWMRSCSR